MEIINCGQDTIVPAEVERQMAEQAESAVPNFGAVLARVQAEMPGDDQAESEPTLLNPVVTYRFQIDKSLQRIRYEDETEGGVVVVIEPKAAEYIVPVTTAGGVYWG